MKFYKKLVFMMAFVMLILGSAFAVLPLPGTIPVLMYHFIGSSENARDSKNFVSRESFAAQMGFLKRFGYHVISMEDYEAVLAGKRQAQGREVVLTFDDGNTTFETEAYPVLEKYDFPATIFLVSESLKQGLNGSMSVETVQRLQASGRITLGAHTKTHPDLTQVDAAGLKEELEVSKRELEALFKVPFPCLAYPMGQVNEAVVEGARAAGYRLAFSTAPKKVKGLEEGLFTLTRPKISRTADNPLVFWVKLTGLYEFYKKTRLQAKASF